MRLPGGFATQAELDAGYDNAAAVTDSARYPELYARESERARAELDCRLGLRFGPTLAEHLDLFPAARPGGALLVFVHGGYWRRFGARDFSFVARGPLARGISVAVTNYALCPHVTIEEIVRQTRAALAWLHARAGELGFDPARIHLGGHSAGGHLVAMAMDWEGDYGLPADLVRGGCAISGLFDLMPLPYSHLQPSLQLTWGEVLRASPIRHLPARAGELVVSWGGRETSEFRRQSEEFLAAWQARGLPARRLEQPEANHYTAILPFLDPESELVRAIADQIEGTS